MVEVSASFRIMGKNLRPSVVTEMLGLDPDHSHELGSPRVGNSGRRYSDFSEGLWELRSKLTASASPADHLRAFVAILIEQQSALRSLRDLGYTMNIFVGIFDDSGNVMFKVESQLMKAVASLEIDVVLDVYGK
jgi:hypothetical protein